MACDPIDGPSATSPIRTLQGPGQPRSVPAAREVGGSNRARSTSPTSCSARRRGSQPGQAHPGPRNGRQGRQGPFARRPPDRHRHDQQPRTWCRKAEQISAQKSLHDANIAAPWSRRMFFGDPSRGGLQNWLRPPGSRGRKAPCTTTWIRKTLCRRLEGIRSRNCATDRNASSTTPNEWATFRARSTSCWPTYTNDALAEDQGGAHPLPPQHADYIGALIADFTPLAVDRLFAEDNAIVGGWGASAGARSWSSAPRKAARRRAHEAQLRHGPSRRLPQGPTPMKMAERFQLPAFHPDRHPRRLSRHRPEERGQAEPLPEQRNCLTLHVPLVSDISARAARRRRGAGRRHAVLMLEHADYSVSRPRACASPCGATNEQSAEAAER